jgi:DNA invertase Pin-like site-specific DNA recombinase
MLRGHLMVSSRYISYIRVSTHKQGRDGLGSDAQRHAIKAHLAGTAGELLAEYTEVESGRRSDRPELANALAACRLHRATLIIAKLDRLARNVAFVSNLMESGVDFVACDMPMANGLTIHMLAAVAEFEAKAISDRTRVALAAAKRRGTALGGFRGRAATDADRDRARVAKIAIANDRATDLATTIRSLQADGATSFRAIAGRLTAMNIPTTGSHNKQGRPTGRNGVWTGVQVRRVIDRVAALNASGAKVGFS